MRSLQWSHSDPESRHPFIKGIVLAPAHDPHTSGHRMCRMVLSAWLRRSQRTRETVVRQELPGWRQLAGARAEWRLMA